MTSLTYSLINNAFIELNELFYQFLGCDFGFDNFIVKYCKPQSTIMATEHKCYSDYCTPHIKTHHIAYIHRMVQISMFFSNSSKDAAAGKTNRENECGGQATAAIVLKHLLKYCRSMISRTPTGGTNIVQAILPLFAFILHIQ